MNITAISNPIHDCFTANIITIATYFQQNFYLWFSNMLTYTNYHRYDVYDIMDKYHGLHCEEHAFECKDALLTFIKQQISQGTPVVLETDIYNCPWNKFYHTNHNQHFILLTEYDNGTLYCLDPYYGTETFTFEFDTFTFNTYSCCRVIATVSDENAKLYIQTLLYFLRNYQQELSYVTISAEKFASTIDLEYIIKSEYDFYNILSVKNIKTSADRRECYIFALEQVEDKTQMDISEPIQLLKDNIKRTKDVQAFILKCIINHDNRHRNKILQMIMEIIARDAQFVNQLIKIFSAYQG